MISVEYVNNGGGSFLYSDPTEVFERYLESCLNDIQQEYDVYKTKICGIMLESTIMGDTSESDTAFLESEGKSMLAKIGDKVIEIGKAFIKMVDALIDKIRSISFGMKSNEKKMDTLIKEHPELGKEKIKILCDEGGLELSDMKSLAQLDDEFDKILAMAKKGQIDPKSIRGRWEKAVKKFNESNKITMVKNVTILLGAAVAIHELRAKFAGANKNARESKDSNRKAQSELYDYLKSCNDPNFTEQTGVCSALLAIYREKNGYHEKALKRDASVINRMNSAIASFIDVGVNSAAGKAVLGNVTASFHADKASQSARRASDKEAELGREQEKAYRQQLGRDKASDEHRSKNNP